MAIAQLSLHIYDWNNIFRFFSCECSQHAVQDKTLQVYCPKLNGLQELLDELRQEYSIAENCCFTL